MKTEDALYTALGNLFNEILQSREDRQQIISQVLEEGERDGNEKVKDYYQRVMNSIDIRGFRSGAKKPLNMVANKLAQETKQNLPVLVELIMTWKEIAPHLWEALSLFLLKSRLTEEGFPFPETEKNYQLCETIATLFAEEGDVLDHEFFELMLMTVLCLLKGEEELKRERKKPMEEPFMELEREPLAAPQESGESDLEEPTVDGDSSQDEQGEEVPEGAGVTMQGDRAHKWDQFLTTASQWPAEDPVWDEVNRFLSSIQEISRKKDEQIKKIYTQMEALLSQLANQEQELIEFFLFQGLKVWEPESLPRQDVGGVSQDLHELADYLSQYKSLHEKQPLNVTERRELSREMDRLEECINPLYERMKERMEEDRAFTDQGDEETPLSDHSEEMEKGPSIDIMMEEEGDTKKE